MNYKVISSEEFEKNVKRLSKKDKYLKENIISRAEISNKQYQSANFISQEQLEIESNIW